MSGTEEVKPKVVEETKEVQTELTPVASPVESQARDQGWVSEQEWVESGRGADEWKTAKEFIKDGEFIKTINGLKREQKQTQATLSALQKHHQHVFERAKLTALEELKKERRQALKEEDVDRVEEIEDKIEQTKEELAQGKAQIQASVQLPGIPPEFEVWKDQNNWYDADEDMRDFADATGLIFINKNKGAKPVEVLKHIDTKMRKQFPDKFGVRRSAQSPTAGVDKTTVRHSKSQDVELDPMERDIMRTLVDSGEMTEAQYKAELKKAKGVR